jgi:hypothetical protein
VKLHTFTWTGSDFPGHDISDLDEPALSAYLARNHADAVEWGVSYAAYNGDVLPWALLCSYDAVTGQTAVRCECPVTVQS